MRIFLVLIITFIEALCCHGQADSAPIQPKQWGEAIEGLQASITLSNSVLETGKSVALSVTIKNSSTNPIGLQADEWRNTHKPFVEAFLISEAGNVVRVTPEGGLDSTGVVAPIALGSGETKEWDIPVDIRKDIHPGVYSLKATQVGIDQKHGFRITANLLKVTVR